MSLKGRYIPDKIMEIPFGNGMTQIEYIPIQHFKWEKPQVVEAVTVEPKKRKSREWIWWTVGVAVFLMGASFGAILQSMYYCVPVFIGSMAYIALVALANSK